MAVQTLNVGSRTYELGSVLGVGGFSEVRKGTDTNTKRKVALKVMFLDSMGSPQEVQSQLKQVQKEIKAMKTLSNTSPNIIRLLGYDLKSQLGDRACIVMVQELAPRGELFDYLMYTKKFPENMTISIFHQLMDGLKAMHNKGIAHRDLKPENLLFDHEWNLKLADFGFSYCFKKGEGPKTKMRTELGTRGYMAPEILANVKYGEKTDIFAAGVILFICLAGFPPFQNAVSSDWWFDKLQKKKYKLFWMAHERTAKFSKEAKEIIQQMLEPKPADRLDVTGVMDTKFYGKSHLTKKELRKALSKRKEIVDSEKEKTRTDGSRDMYVKAVFAHRQKLGGKQLLLQDLLRNGVRASLEKNEVNDALKQLASHKGRMLALLEDDVLKVDINDAGSLLCNAKDASGVQEVLNVDNKTAADVLYKLNYSEIMGPIEDYDKDLFETLIGLDEAELPDFDIYASNVTATRVNMKFGLMTFALKLFCDQKPNKLKKLESDTTFVKERDLEIDVEQQRCEIKFSFEKEIELPVDDDSEVPRFEKASLEYEMEIGVELYNDPTTEYNIVVFKHLNKTALTGDDFNTVIHQLTTATEFLMAALIEEDQDIKIEAHTQEGDNLDVLTAINCMISTVQKTKEL